MSKTHGKLKISIIGASGYTGAELIRLLHNHDKVEIVSLVADSNAGKPVAQIYPHLKNFNLPDLTGLSEIGWDGIDLVFCCLPHATAQEIIKNIPQRIRIIDLSADFRLYDTKVYEKWYGTPHKAPELQKEAVYGLSELFRDPIKAARIVACPGCYPTSALVPLIPLLRRNLIENDRIIIDSKSGVTGAGRSAKQSNLYCEVNEGIKAYGVCEHRHIPEIEQMLSAAAGSAIEVNFTPQLVPMNRGILTTAYVKLAKDVICKDLRETLEERYNDDSFIKILPEGEYPSTLDVRGTNQCHIAVAKARTADMAVIISVIDNLVKGASGQAVQNMNIMFGFEENTGLDMIAAFP